MTRFTVREATTFFRSYEVKCEEKLVQEWMDSIDLDDDTQPLSEEDLHEFNEWRRWKGTAYEEGIDDQTKIARLIEENRALMIEVELLKKEKCESESIFL